MTLKTFEQQAVRELAGRQIWQLHRILVPIDFSPASKSALEYALRLAEGFHAELKLLNVVPPAPRASGCESESEELCSRNCGAKELKPLLAMAEDRVNESVDWTVRVGVPSFEIVQVAKEVEADLIVIATHGYSGWKHFCIGSTAERVVRAAPCAVLVVREKEYQLS